MHASPPVFLLSFFPLFLLSVLLFFGDSDFGSGAIQAVRLQSGIGNLPEFGHAHFSVRLLWLPLHSLDLQVTRVKPISTSFDKKQHR